jgi:transposase-like protein
MEENKGVRKFHPPAFKAKVAMEAIKGEKTIAQLSGIYGVHSSLVTKWKAVAITSLEHIFANPKQVTGKDKEELIDELYRQIGQLKVQIDWLKKKMGLIEQ